MINEALDPDFEMPSDDELIEEEGELEDNFVELAGGKHVKMDEDDEEDAAAAEAMKNQERAPASSTSNLPLHKVRMMERFLWGSESPGGADPESYGAFPPSEDAMGLPPPSTTMSSIRKGRPLTEQEELLEKQFDRVCVITC